MGDSGTRLLIAAGAAAAGPEELPPLVRALIDTASDVLVVSPVLTTKLQWLASDVDPGRVDAGERLRTILEQMSELAPQAETRGAIGDETPLTAFEDAVSSFRPDHILVALRAAEHGDWQEPGLVEQVLETFHIPVTVFELDRDGRVPPATRP